MVRTIVKIDEEKCNGCGACVPGCAEGALQIIDGKARLVGELLCDGLGACLGECPEGAITLEERDADEYDEAAVEVRLKDLGRPLPPAHGQQSQAHGHQPPPALQTQGHALHTPTPAHHGGGCPGSAIRDRTNQQHQARPAAPTGEGNFVPVTSQLRQWPVQLHLVPPTAPFFQNADVVIAADCSAFAVGDFHGRFLKNKSLAIACPKLDQGQDIYMKKITAMIDQAQVNTLQVIVMEVPCCRGLASLVQAAAAAAQRKVPVKQTTISLEGEVLSESWL